MFIDGFAISNFRSFGEDMQKFGPFSKVNLFIGQNNSGKSNVLLFIYKYYNSFINSAKNKGNNLNITEENRHARTKANHIHFGFALAKNSYLHKEISEKNQSIDNKVLNELDTILFNEPVVRDKNLAWILFEGEYGSNLELSSQYIRELLHFYKDKNKDDYSNLMNYVSNTGEVHSWPQHVSRIFSLLIIPNIKIPKICLIPAFRRIINTEDSTTNDFDGRNIIEQLDRLQNPSNREQYQEKKNDFEKINKFLCDVTGIQNARIEIPSDKTTVMVNLNNQVFPLEELGTGIHEVTIFAVAATLNNESIICIEEPEIHLHPTLQKKLLYYLKDETTNQYFISTHSAHFLDIPEVTIFHIHQDNGITLGKLALSCDEKFSITNDLGYRASDIMQSNCIIWVEGPSDRIYLSHWITKRDTLLKEGVHYAIMFYGGGLLSHLTPKDTDTDEFIALCRLNRNIAILIDSDKRSSDASINETKTRVKDELSRDAGIVWITAGRTIENYLPPEQIKKAFELIHPSFSHQDITDQYSDALMGIKKSDSEPIKQPNKVKIARYLSNHEVDWKRLDLETRILELINFIRRANGIQSISK